MKNKIKKITYITIIFSILIMIALIIAMVVNINKIYSEYNDKISISQENQSNDELVENYEETSIEIGKTVEESKSEINEENNEKTEKAEEVNKKDTKEAKETKKVEEPKKEVVEEKIVIPDPTFIKPVNGEIIKEYNKEGLIYSETLKEWTTHTGIDISSELSSVVKASADGTVKAIKNDPRYGITVILLHVNGYETRYSNLLTAEFIKEGENIKQRTNNRNNRKYCII